MQRIQILVRRICGATIGALTVDSWRMGYLDKARKEQISKLEDKIQRLEKANCEQSIADSNKIIELAAKGLDIEEYQKEYTRLSDISNNIINQINTGKLDENKKNELFQQLHVYSKSSAEVLKKVNEKVKDLNDTHIKNDVSSIISEAISKYKSFLSELSVDQLACLSNGIGYFLIISALQSLSISYYANKFIGSFNLESKYPKLAKYLLFKSKVSDKLIKLQIIYILSTSIIMLIVNIYMLINLIA